MIFIGMKRKFLNEDGSLNVGRINKLPYEEYMDAMGMLTQEQIEEYNSKLPINESDEPMQAVWVDYSLEEEFNRGSVDAIDFLNEMKKNL